jgi:hypothetical protein
MSRLFARLRLGLFPDSLSSPSQHAWTCSPSSERIQDEQAMLLGAIFFHVDGRAWWRKLRRCHAPTSTEPARGARVIRL